MEIPPTFNSRKSYNPIRREVSIDDLRTALPRLYTSSFFNHPIRTSEGECIVPEKWVEIENATDKPFLHGGEHTFYKVKIYFKFKDRIDEWRAWVSDHGLANELNRMKHHYLNDLTLETYDAKYASYTEFRGNELVQTHDRLYDCLQDWLDSFSIQELRPKTE